MRHYEDSIKAAARPEQVFAFVDDFRRFSSHMSQSSLMMGGGTMDLTIDDGGGKKVGSIVRMGGRIFGLNLYLEETVTEHQPPFTKAWQTIGTPRLLVIGHYKMRLTIEPRNNDSVLKVSIDYELPPRNVWMGELFGGMYARWCVQQMIGGVRKQFA